MAVSLFNDTDMRLITQMTPSQVRGMMATMSIKAALIFRRNLQISLASYSKRHPAIGKIDKIQGACIGICKQIGNAARDAFTITGWRKIKAKYPNMTLIERRSRKHDISVEWERLLKTFTY